MTLLGLLARAETEVGPVGSRATVERPIGRLWPCCWPPWRLGPGSAGGFAADNRRSSYEDHRPVPWHGCDVAIIFCRSVPWRSASARDDPAVYDAVPAAEGKIPDEVLAGLFAGQSVSEVCVMLFAIGLLMRRRGADWADLGFDLRRLGRDLGIGLIGFLFIAAPVLLLYGMLEPKELHPLIELAMRRPSQLWLIGLCAVVVAPLVEEFFFRVDFAGLAGARRTLAGARRAMCCPRCRPACCRS